MAFVPDILTSFVPAVVFFLPEMSDVRRLFQPLLCILALSSVINRRIQTFYPDFGVHKYKLFFNQTIQPRCFVSSAENINMFCREGSQLTPFQPNHFVPLVFCENSRKRSYPLQATKSLAKICEPKQSKLCFPSSTSAEVKHTSSMCI